MGTRLARWERRTQWPLTVVALLFLIAYAWPILEPDLGPGWRRACSAVTWGTWVLYAADYLYRFRLATGKREFVREHLLDLAAVLLPLLRPLQLLRVLLVFDVVHERLSMGLRGRVVAQVAVLVAMLSALAALAMLDAERDNPEANITSYSDALWWAGTTITTVGYGDRYPTTSGGRVVGFAVMLGGIALLGVLTAAVASWFVSRSAAEDRTEATLEEVLEELRDLRALVSRDEADRPPHTPSR
jgi:voltage-gated potassium channel